jgi:hypothetical protein
MEEEGSIEGEDGATPTKEDGTSEESSSKEGGAFDKRAP